MEKDEIINMFQEETKGTDVNFIDWLFYKFSLVPTKKLVKYYHNIIFENPDDPNIHSAEEQAKRDTLDYLFGEDYFYDNVNRMVI